VAEFVAGAQHRLRARLDLEDLEPVFVMLALGLSIIFGMLGIVNFAHGNVFMVGAYVASGPVAEFVAGAQHRLRARLDLEDLEQVGLALHSVPCS
jgi:ABC-type branched-subunit amino acid transport system permease subunit